MVHLDRGRVLLSQGRYEQAETEFRRYLAEEPDDPGGHVLLAEALLGRDEPIAASEEAQRAIGLDPEFDIAHACLSRAMLQRNRFDEALAAIDSALRLDTADADYFAIRAAIRFQKEDRKGALDDVRESLAIDAENAIALDLHPAILRSLGRLDDAARASDEGLRQRADSADAHITRGWVLMEQRQPKQARHHFREALRIDPNSDVAKAGLVESIKATNWVYRKFLDYGFWMGRLQPGTRMAVLIGAFVGYQFLVRAARTYPQYAWLLLPLVGLYIVAAVITWIAGPLFNLMLRVHPDGKHALSNEQRAGSNLLAVSALASLLALATYFLSGDGNWLYRATVLLILMLPVSAIMSIPSGWPRKTMAAICIGIALLVAAGIASDAIEARVSGIMILLLLGSQFVANWLAGISPKDA